MVWLALFVSNVAAGMAGVLAKDAWGGTLLHPLAAVAALGASYAAVLVLVATIARRNGFSFARAVCLDARPGGLWVVAALVAVVIARFAGVGALELLSAVGANIQRTKNGILNEFGPGVAGLIAAAMVAIVLAPFAEEVVFRGVLLSALSNRFGRVAGVLVSSVVFAAIHVQPAVVVVVFFAGLAFAWLAVHYKSLWPPVLAHGVFNALSLVAILANSAGARS